MTAAKAIVKSLHRLGVEYAFGMPGAQNLELFDAFLDSGIKNILVTNELSAAFMADGYSRVTGKPGVCVVIPGPGLTNMITGLAEAYLDSSSLVVLVVGFGSPEHDFHIHQIRQLEAVKPVVKQTLVIDDAGRVQEGIYNAFSLAQRGEPGPVVVQISKELLNKKAEYKESYKDIGERLEDDKDKIREITEMIKGAGLCGIYAGGGAFAAAEELKELAEAFSMPVSTTVSGRGVLPEDHPLCLGFGFGPSGTRLAEDIFKKCDLILALGCKFSEMSTGSWGLEMAENLIHIDKNSDVLNKNYPAKISLCKDVRTALQELLGQLKDVKREENAQLLDKISQEKQKNINGLEKEMPDGGWVRPRSLFAELRSRMPRDAILVTDCGNHQLFAISDFLVFKERTFVTPCDYQAMGFGLPAAIGAKIGCRDKKVVCVCGDGGFLVSGFEILTAVRERLDLAVIVFNDGSLGLIKALQEGLYGRTTCVDFPPLDYGNLSKALGIDYVEINSTAALTEKLPQALSKKGVVLIDLKVQYDCLPDYVKGVQKALFKRLTLSEKLDLISKQAQKFFK